MSEYTDHNAVLDAVLAQLEDLTLTERRSVLREVLADIDRPQRVLTKALIDVLIGEGLSNDTIGAASHDTLFERLRGFVDEAIVEIQRSARLAALERDGNDQ